jgi:CheY-like chemotaxis protein
VSDGQPIGKVPRILVVDDNDNRYTLTLYLDLEGYTDVQTAHDEEAIARLAAATFDLVLLDVMMPKVDGYQVLTWIIGQARLRDVSVCHRLRPSRMSCSVPALNGAMLPGCADLCSKHAMKTRKF